VGEQAELFVYQLESGHEIKIDAADVPLLFGYRWVAIKSPGRDVYYAQASHQTGGKVRIIHMHRLLLQPGQKQLVDHINGDGLDNRRCNLRIANHAQNTMNSRLRSDNTSGYRGITYRKDSGKWQAVIHAAGERRRLGCFNTKEEAALAYNEGARAVFGEFARLNVIKGEVVE
jgi:hypothetical protein